MSKQPEDIQQIGSIVQGPSQGGPGIVPGAPTTIGTGAFSSDLSAALEGLDTGDETTPEISLTKKGKTTAGQLVPGFGALSYNDAWLEPFNYTEGQMLRFQKRLAAAGYIQVSQKGDLNVRRPGFYDNETRNAMAQLLLDAQVGGYNPKALLEYQIGLAAGGHPSAKNIRPFEDAKVRFDENAAAYEEVWKLKPTEDYMASLSGMNPEEVKAYERAKATFQNSDVAAGEQTAALDAIKQFFTRS